MKRTSVVISLLFALPLSAFESNAYLYGGYSFYDKSIKDSAYYAGMYSSFVQKEHKLELAYEFLEVDFFNENPLLQHDLIAVYSNYLNKNWMIKAGIHYILMDKSQVYITGLKYFEGYAFEMGIDLYFSNLPQFSAANSALQLEPYLGFSFGEYYSNFGSFYLKIIYDYIALNNIKTSLLDTSYNSGAIDLSHFKGDLATSLHLWIGKQVYGVRNEGFTVYNLDELHTSGLSLSMGYLLTSNLGFKGTLYIENFEEAQTNTVSGSPSLRGFGGGNGNFSLTEPESGAAVIEDINNNASAVGLSLGINLIY